MKETDVEAVLADLKKVKRWVALRAAIMGTLVIGGAALGLFTLLVAFLGGLKLFGLI